MTRYTFLRKIDAVVLTHNHWDAIGGLDDLRDWTNNQPHQEERAWCFKTGGREALEKWKPEKTPSWPIPVFLTEEDLARVREVYPYLVEPRKAAGGGVSTLTFHVIRPYEAFEPVAGLKLLPLPVWHGPGVRCLGFKFGRVAYFSDVSEMPEETLGQLRGQAAEDEGRLELLVLDMLGERPHPSHLHLDATVQLVRDVWPRSALFTGMCHAVDHEAMCARLAGLPWLGPAPPAVRLSFDGMRMPIALPPLDTTSQ